MNKSTIKVLTKGKHAKIAKKMWDSGGSINE